MRYLNTLRNQLLVSRAWMFTTLLLALACGYLLIQIGHLASGMPTRLVPYEFALMDGPVEVDGNGRSSEEYMTHIAIADLSLYTDWTPRTVEGQTARFLNRLTPRLYGNAEGRLSNRAAEASEAEHAQSFFVESTAVRDNEVRLEGELETWSGSDRETHEMAYTLRYTFQGGMPYVTGFESTSLEN